jgi:hypothetical protein
MGDALPMRVVESQGGCWAGAVRVFLTCWLLYTVFWTPWIVREHFPAIALAESGHLNVERYLGWTEGIFPGPRGGAYINNNPGGSADLPEAKTANRITEGNGGWIGVGAIDLEGSR